jgi:hypothetical protein
MLKLPNVIAFVSSHLPRWLTLAKSGTGTSITTRKPKVVLAQVLQQGKFCFSIIVLYSERQI